MGTLTLSLELGEDPHFDQLVAAVVRFGEMRLKEGRTPGEVQLELLAGDRFDEQVVHSAAPVLESIYDLRQSEQGFGRWLLTRPLRANKSFGRLLSEVAAAAVALVLSSYLIYRFSLQSMKIEWLGALLAAAIVPLIAAPMSYLTYRFDRMRFAHRVARYRDLLDRDSAGGAAPPMDRPSPDAVSLRA